MANKNKRAFYVNGKMLRKIISLRGLTQTDVYKAIGIGENTIYRVIKYNRMENRNDFDRMCEFLDADPDLLQNEKYDIVCDEDGHIMGTITSDNIDEYLHSFGYNKKDEDRFTPTYIHQFFKNVLDAEPFGESIERFLFDKIIECRDLFADKYNSYISAKLAEYSQGKTKSIVDESDFKQLFNSWFEKNIKNN